MNTDVTFVYPADTNTDARAYEEALFGGRIGCHIAARPLPPTFESTANLDCDPDSDLPASPSARQRDLVEDEIMRVFRVLPVSSRMPVAPGFIAVAISRHPGFHHITLESDGIAVSFNRWVSAYESTALGETVSADRVNVQNDKIMQTATIRLRWDRWLAVA